MHSPRTPMKQLRRQKPHVYRNYCTGTWVCDAMGTRINPGPDRARTVCRTHLEAVRVAMSIAPPGG
ncbi:hypothetical protein GCM10011581_43670 [Saccharopolyspora subtropica]|uniref:Uncharacterized protein n=1 Tax=Saccharopolyspora thermophila TaxID=89367 RepID=A0A917NHU8_9PSEU|nr:hypothetical protein [Saccharopolyspora subtropica]GGJ01768.1 hypothetical protein GCM10011581_43670 [Saccharopolyspora subtropica]